MVFYTLVYPYLPRLPRLCKMPSTPTKNDFEDLLKECESSLAIVRRILAAYPTDRVGRIALPALETELEYLVEDVGAWLDILSTDEEVQGERGGYREGRDDGKGKVKGKKRRVPSKDKFDTIARFVELSRGSIILPQARRVGLSICHRRGNRMGFGFLGCGFVRSIFKPRTEARTGLGIGYKHNFGSSIHQGRSPYRSPSLSLLKRGFSMKTMTHILPFLFLFLVQSLAIIILDSTVHSSPPWVGNCYVPFATSFVATYGLLLRDDCCVSWTPTFWFCVVLGLCFWVYCLGSCGRLGLEFGFWLQGVGSGE